MTGPGTKAYAMSFEGELLTRGFWLYAWRVTDHERTVVYVGRTGDSSSPYAGSPFRRIGQHLDPRVNAKGNALARLLKKAGFVPERCRFEMVAVGPVFPEQENMDQHRPLRDQAAALERALAAHLKAAGHEVLGTHPRVTACDETLCAEVCRMISEKLGPPRRRS